jgi:uncharacterized membrane protein YecN with MAPEG domain
VDLSIGAEWCVGMIPLLACRDRRRQRARLVGKRHEIPELHTGAAATYVYAVLCSMMCAYFPTWEHCIGARGMLSFGCGWLVRLCSLSLLYVWVAFCVYILHSKSHLPIWICGSILLSDFWLHRFDFPSARLNTDRTSCVQISWRCLMKTSE